MKPTIKVTFNTSKCEVKSNEGEQTLTLDLSELSEDDYEQYALRSIVIGLQAKIRSAKEKFNFELPITVKAPGSRITTGDRVNKVKEALNKLTEEQKMEIAKAMGFTYVPAALVTEVNEELENGEV